MPNNEAATAHTPHPMASAAACAPFPATARANRIVPTPSIHTPQHTTAACMPNGSVSGSSPHSSSSRVQAWRNNRRHSVRILKNRKTNSSNSPTTASWYPGRAVGGSDAPGHSSGTATVRQVTSAPNTAQTSAVSIGSGVRTDVALNESAASESISPTAVCSESLRNESACSSFIPLPDNVSAADRDNVSIGSVAIIHKIFSGQSGSSFPCPVPNRRRRCAPCGTLQ